MLLDAVIDYLPSPLDIPAGYGDQPGHRRRRATRPRRSTHRVSALVFKIQTDPYMGKLAYVRVYSGVLQSGTTLANTSKDRKERMGRLVQVYAEKREDVTMIRRATSARSSA